MSKSAKDIFELPFQPGWGRKSGFLSLPDFQNKHTEPATRDLLQIMESAPRYCWSYDERDKKKLKECFTEDAVWEGNVTGDVKIGPFCGRDSIVKWMSEFWPHQLDQRRHMIMNTIVESLSSDRAVTLSYILLTSANRDRVKLETTGFYRLQLKKHNDVWKIVHLFAGFDYPFWPKKISELSAKGKARHGINVSDNSEV